jgi:hypothetical protein
MGGDCCALPKGVPGRGLLVGGYQAGRTANYMRKVRTLWLRARVMSGVCCVLPRARDLECCPAITANIMRKVRTF